MKKVRKKLKHSVFFKLVLTLLVISSCAREPNVMYLWETNNEIDRNIFVWKDFGNEDMNPKYIGEIQKENPDGFGTTIYPDGFKYVGEYKEGKKHGQGTWFTTVSGEMKRLSQGEWKFGYFWNMTTYDFEGKKRDTFNAGLLTYGVLFSYLEDNSEVWLLSLIHI